MLDFRGSSELCREVTVIRVVDVHAHTLVPEAQLLVERRCGLVAQQAAGRRAATAVHTGLFGRAGLGPLVDLDTRLSAMDAAGVDARTCRPCRRPAPS
jgi:hypothetical protein